MGRPAAQLGLVLASALCGCDGVFHLVPVDELPPDAFIAACSGAGEIEDDFDDNTINMVRWNAWSRQGASATEANGEAVLDLGSGAVPDQAMAEFVSRGEYDFTGHRVSVEVTRITNLNSRLQAVLFARVLTAENALALVAEGGYIACGVREMGSYRTVYGPAMYDPAFDRFWSIREDAGQVLFETSPDRSSWRTLVTYSPPFAITSLNVGVYTYMDSAGTDPGLAAFDNFSFCATTPK